MRVDLRIFLDETVDDHDRSVAVVIDAEQKFVLLHRHTHTHTQLDTLPEPDHSLISNADVFDSSSFLACNSRLHSAIRRHHPPQRAVLSQICCFGEPKVVLFQILLDGAEPRDAGTT